MATLLDGIQETPREELQHLKRIWLDLQGNIDELNTQIITRRKTLTELRAQGFEELQDLSRARRQLTLWKNIQDRVSRKIATIVILDEIFPGENLQQPSNEIQLELTLPRENS